MVRVPVNKKLNINNSIVSLIRPTIKVFSSRRLILISVNSFNANDPPTINVYKECRQHNDSSLCIHAHVHTCIHISILHNEIHEPSSPNQKSFCRICRVSRVSLPQNFSQYLPWTLHCIENVTSVMCAARKKKTKQKIGNVACSFG